MSVEGGPETINENGSRKTSQEAAGIVQGESSGGPDKSRVDAVEGNKGHWHLTYT